MFWFKHFTNRHEDIDLIESILQYGSSAYHLYFVLHELYGYIFHRKSAVCKPESIIQKEEF
jgi:hypothetical protein